MASDLASDVAGTTGRPLRLSVVIAAPGGGRAPDECLAALAGQAAEIQECIVVGGGELQEPIVPRALACRWMEAGRDALVPQLWQQGIEAASGDLVAITTSQFVPARDWAAALRSAFLDPNVAGAGGRIDPPEGGSMSAWAAYFLRYSSYATLEAAREVGDIAGDNACYRAAELRRHRAVTAEGFWEPDFHRAARGAGGVLWFDPRIRVRQVGDIGLWSFAAQRVHHGRQFGRSRAADWSAAQRALRVLASPLIPVVFFAKIAGRVLRVRGNRFRFVASLPALVILLLGWSLGEVQGYLGWSERGRRRGEPGSEETLRCAQGDKRARSG